jgi:Sulfotransferase domain
MSEKHLDFFVIGAMKAGTTSLHYYLKGHPDVFLPVEKEVPFFAFDELYERGMDWYLNEFFAKARADQLLGTVSPRYMMDSRVPERMFGQCPDAKLIALLRDPIDRARSHYRMAVRAFDERRPLEEALDGQYTQCGLYGKWLSGFMRRYPLEQAPVETMGEIAGFLGIAPEKLPSSARKHHAAGDSRKHPLLRFAANTIHYRSRWLRPLIKKLLPTRYTRRLGRWSILYRNRGAPAGAVDATLSPEAEQRLAELFLGDLEVLETIATKPVPWRSRLEALRRGAAGSPNAAARDRRAATEGR